MPRFAANLSMLFTEVPFLDRFERAAQAGFEAVEFLFPYAHTVEEIKERLDATGLQIVLHNLPAGDWDAGERGIACDPQRVDEFRAGVAKAVSYAHALGVPQLNCLAGKAPAGVDAAVLGRTFVENLRFAAAALKMAKLRLLIEPINPFDIPGFYLNRTDQAIAILDEVGADNAFVQYDIYHAQRVEGELAATLQKNLARNDLPADTSLVDGNYWFILSNRRLQAVHGRLRLQPVQPGSRRSCWFDGFLACSYDHLD